MFTHTANDNKHANVLVGSLGIFDEGMREWLLSKYKHCLIELLFRKEMQRQAQSRLQLLREYCESTLIDFDLLIRATKEVPIKVYSKLDARHQLPKG